MEGGFSQIQSHIIINNVSACALCVRVCVRVCVLSQTSLDCKLPKLLHSKIAHYDTYKLHISYSSMNVSLSIAMASMKTTIEVVEKVDIATATSKLSAKTSTGLFSVGQRM